MPRPRSNVRHTISGSSSGSDCPPGMDHGASFHYFFKLGFGVGSMVRQKLDDGYPTNHPELDLPSETPRARGDMGGCRHLS